VPGLAGDFPGRMKFALQDFDRADVRYGSIVLQKSFFTGDQKFSGM
jgi:hypothetical protein